MSPKYSYSKILFAIMIFVGGLTHIAVAEEEAICSTSSTPVSRLTLDTGRLCYNGKTVRLVGYSGQFVEVTVNSRWTAAACSSNCNPSAGSCSSTPVNNSLKNLQIDLATPRSGSNFQRILALGASCTQGFSASEGTCNGYAGRPEIMPFKRLASGKFNVTFANSASLDACWEARFRKFLVEAEKNGIVVMVGLFDENTMTGSTSWTRNPWNPNNNNMSCSLPTSGSGLPSFYNVCSNMANKSICSTAELNCLGQVQKGYVDKVVQAVKDSGAKNVIFEVMNEARLESNANETDAAIMATWHNTVASWATNFIWAASVKKGPSHPDPFGLLNACVSSTNCTDPTSTTSEGNPNLVFWKNNIDVVSLHYKNWQNGICSTDDAALRFGKPVIFDDDGGGALADGRPRNDNSKVTAWAKSVCGRPRGTMHFYHTGDGPELKGTVPSGLGCEEDDTKFLDCTAMDALQNNIGSATYLCGIAGACPARGTYCDTCYGRTTGLVTTAEAFPSVLNPADGSMVPVMVALDIKEISYPYPVATLISIEANEDLATGDVEADFGTDDRTVFLRATKSFNITDKDYEGRVYSLLYQITDSEGNISFAKAKVTVP